MDQKEIVALTIDANTLFSTSALEAAPFSLEACKEALSKSSHVLCLCDNPVQLQEVKTLCLELGKTWIDPLLFSQRFKDPSLSLEKRALVFGALSLFPISDSIVIHFGAFLQFDYVKKTGQLILGPKLRMQESVDSLKSSYPLFSDEEEKRAKAGSYYGLLGAIERIISEMNQESCERSSVKVIATGPFFLQPSSFQDDLLELIDSIEPHLLHKGLIESIKEYTSIINSGD